MNRTIIQVSLIYIFAFSIIFADVFSVFYRSSVKGLEIQCEQKSERDLDKVLLMIDSQMDLTEQVTKTFSDLVFREGISVPDTAQIYQRFATFLRHHPQFTGVSAGFEEGVYPYVDCPTGFVPLLRRDDRMLIRYQLGELSDERANDWYTTTKEENVARWTEPRTSIDGENICSYCLPLHDTEGNFIGVFSVDLPISGFTEAIATAKPYPNSTISIIDNADLSTIIDNPNTVNLSEDILADLNQGRRGNAIVKEGEEEFYLYYAPLEYANWSAILSSSRADVQERLTDSISGMGILIINGIAILAFLMIAFSIYYKKRKME